jgi:hypothetical protein
MAAKVTLAGLEITLGAEPIKCPLVGVDVEDMEYDSYSAIHPDAGNHVMVKVLRHTEETGNFLCEECQISLGFNSDGIVVEMENA